MKRLLVYDYFRGPDSTGLAAISRNVKEHKIAKIASHPFDLFDTMRFKTALAAAASSALIGHNRAATKGVVNTVNAHPYEFGHIVGAHNGTLETSSWRALEAAVGEKFEVDSQAIFAAIEKLGIEATVPMLEGAWALVWVNLQDQTLNFLRNDKREFWYAYSEDFNKLIWASEWPMISLAVKSNGHLPKLYVEADKKANYSYWSTPVDVWMKWDLPSLVQGGHQKKPKPVAKTLKGKEPAPVAQKAIGYNPFPKTGSTTSFTGTTSNIISLRGTNDDPFAGFIQRKQFNVLRRYGCSWCGNEDFAFDDKGITIFQKEELILCPDCSGGNPNHNHVFCDDMELVRKVL